MNACAGRTENRRMAHAEQVLNCSFHRWYPAFQAVSFRSQFVPLPKEFVEYLVEDGVYLPENNAAVSVADALTCRKLEELMPEHQML